MMEQGPIHRASDRRWIWCGLILLVGAAAMLIRIPTHLGVKVPETNIPGLDPALIDTSGHERIWRVWWRAHDDFISVHPQWILTVGLLAILALFVLGLLAAIWFALAPVADATDRAE